MGLYWDYSSYMTKYRTPTEADRCPHCLCLEGHLASCIIASPPPLHLIRETVTLGTFTIRIGVDGAICDVFDSLMPGDAMICDTMEGLCLKTPVSGRHLRQDGEIWGKFVTGSPARRTVRAQCASGVSRGGSGRRR